MIIPNGTNTRTGSHIRLQHTVIIV